MSLSIAVRRFATRRHVRPWALCAPILVLIISIPLLRPLHMADTSQISDDEQARLATVQAIVEHRTLSIDDTDFRDTRARIVAKSEIGNRFPTRTYSNQPPMLAVLMSGPYWLLQRLGLTFGRDPSSTVFWLTLICITLPVAAAASLVYRMSRIFEIKRPYRAALALTTVIGSGLVSYSTVINAHAPAAVLVLATATIFLHLLTHYEPALNVGWLLVAGLFTALAAAIDPPAAVFLLLFAVVIGAFRWPIVRRGLGIALYAIGAALPVALHAKLVRPITGDLRPGMFHPELADGGEKSTAPADAIANSPMLAAAKLSALAAATPSLEEDDLEPLSRWQKFTHGLYRIYSAFFGWHGLLSHFPIVVVGIIGVVMIMHRHWPMPTKVLAAATLGGALAIILVYAITRTSTRDAMFATRWFVVFLPMTLFWSGAWLRRRHSHTSWIAVLLLLAFSVGASILGATGPIPRNGFDQYTVAGAWQRLIHPAPPPVYSSPLADRGNQDAIPE